MCGRGFVSYVAHIKQGDPFPFEVKSSMQAFHRLQEPVEVVVPRHALQDTERLEERFLYTRQECIRAGERTILAHFVLGR
ncbi:hypothetical protein PsorP6_015822 [Peronosclerospora sorghi]|uniref:Uncharacterized protein n=1 Tax=Peronosclerospora sorghi TaxID=230839 RepID=A0ACC0WM97_9STRA|nr:hypothetical protein PsorP6_015822 [Peronosclerospora sorghi]